MTLKILTLKIFHDVANKKPAPRAGMTNIDASQQKSIRRERPGWAMPH